MNILKVLPQFLKAPKKYEDNLSSKNYLSGFKQFLIFDLCLAFAWGLLIAILSFISDDLQDIMKSNNFHQNSVSTKFFLFSLIIPFIEEFSFRLGLKITKLNVSISFGFQFIILLQLFQLIELPLYFRIILMFLTGTVIYFLINSRLLYFLKSNFRSYLFYNILFFSFLHLLNYNYNSNFQFLFAPVLILNPFLFGCFMSYARLKYDFPFATLLHIFHNLIVLLLGFLFINF